MQLVLKSLEADLRKMMSPNTATNLRVSVASVHALYAACSTGSVALLAALPC